MIKIANFTKQTEGKYRCILCKENIRVIYIVLKNITTV